jgi:pSer/pThr/pTyr-binding forkhead associated (FHA) protein
VTEPPLRTGRTAGLPGRLTVVEGDDDGLVFLIGDEAIVGRGIGVEIQVRGHGVSRRHARLSRDDEGRIVLSDLGSANGTFVNDVRTERCILESGDQIRIARDVSLEFRYEHPDDRVTTDLGTRRGPSSIETSLLSTMLNLGRLHLSSGDHARALKPLDRALEKMRARPEADPRELASLLTDVAECCVELGHAERGRTLAEESVLLSRTAAPDPRIAARAGFVAARALADVDYVRARELAIEARGRVDDREPIAQLIDAWLS